MSAGSGDAATGPSGPPAAETATRTSGTWAAETATQVAVIGAGAAGLAAALDLRARGIACLVLEASAEPGGTLQSVAREGYLFERGPNAFRISAPARAWLRRHALLHVLRPAAGAEARLRKLFLDGRLVAVPERLGAAVRSPLLSAAGKRRALREACVRRGDATGESVAEFVERRFGREVLERAVAPFLIGVYAGDERELGAEAVLPSLVELERRHGSVLRGGLARGLRRRGGRREEEVAPPGSWSAQGGVAGLARAAAERLRGDLRLMAPVSELVRENGAWRIETASGERLRAGALVVATEAPAAARLLAPHDPELAEGLAGIDYAPLVTLALGADPARSREPLEGFGFLVPRQAGLELLGALFPSRVFPGRAPEGRELVVPMLGGRRWPGAVEASDEALLERVAQGLEATLGLRDSEPLGIHRWPAAVPQLGVGHVARVAELRRRAAALGGLALAGGYLDGVGVSAALASGAAAAAAVEPSAR